MEEQKIFLSYSRSDSTFALKLAKDLRAANVSIWIDQLDIHAGSRWDLSVEKALAEANSIIVILSKSSATSENVMDEVSYAIEGGKTVFPVKLDECNIPFRLKRLQFIDFTSGYDQGLAKLLAGMGREQPAASTISGASSKQSYISTILSDPQNRKMAKRIGAAFAVIVIISIGLYEFKKLESLKDKDNKQQQEGQSRPARAERSIDIGNNIRVWKVGSPHQGEIPDSTSPFELQKEAKILGYALSVEGFPAKGFANKFFEAFDRHEEPDILAINNYGIIDGITTTLGNFTGIGNNIIKEKMIHVHGSLTELEDSGGGWQFLFSTSKNHQAAKLLAVRQPRCDPKLKATLDDINKTVANDLHRYTLKYVLESNRFHATLGSDFNVIICGFWGNNNIAFLETVVDADEGNVVGWNDVLIIMAKNELSWDLVNLGGSTNIITELNEAVKLTASAPGNSPRGDLKVVGPADGTKSTRSAKPSLEWEWGGDIQDIAVNLVEWQFQSGSNNWSRSHFVSVQPQGKVKLVAPFGIGAQPHRWKVWAIDKNGSFVRSNWSTINFTD